MIDGGARLGLFAGISVLMGQNNGCGLKGYQCVLCSFTLFPAGQPFNPIRHSEGKIPNRDTSV